MRKQDKPIKVGGASTYNDLGEGGADRSRRFAFFRRSLDRSGTSLFYQSTNLVHQWVEHLPSGLAEAAVVGHRDSAFLPELPAERLMSLKRKVVETGEEQALEMPIKIGEQLRWFKIWIDPDTDVSGRVMGLISTFVEITEQKQREHRIKALLREVSHRSKNLLAIVLSLASQTARNSQSLPGFVAAFSGRIQSIARAQDLVTDRDWQGALFSDLVARQSALFQRDRALPVFLSGADPVISPTAALYVGLAIHELLANGVREGRFMAADARADIGAHLNVDADGNVTFVIRWEETGEVTLSVGSDSATQVFDELSRKFLETVVPLAVEGDGKLALDSKHLSYQLTIDGRHVS